ncbi:HAMP domain-containing histidine kinase [Glaciecola sp. MH2013]|uniref:sensor histidine kinase n=1 Tax=Glaciecola sp. MH2013 TaxID=2785524 RepID=UPI00189E9175|nr:HAMP domain-containing sensor histidine kinase [Glaciecola sp. MH2013]MBF7074941.1 HAMP domain-containing histidine kinase [Glaciecola sp. MH2013]
MRISYKLMFIVVLTLIEISITLWSVVELSKGATLHQLNSLHLKNSAIFSRQVSDFVSDIDTDIDTKVNSMEKTVLEIKQQPLDCLDIVNALNIIIMKAIGTYEAYLLCEKDIKDVDKALDSIDQFRAQKLSLPAFLSNMEASAIIFTENSALFEKPITQTVNFLLAVFIPLVVIISLLNILLITFLSRNITQSIGSTIRVMKEKNSSLSQEDIFATTTGELRELLIVASERARETVLQEEINEKLEQLVFKRTESLSHANDELTRFAYRTSHDLKGPVSASKSLAQFIQQDIDAGNYTAAKADAMKVELQMKDLEAHISGILSLTKATEIEDSSNIINVAELLRERIAVLERRSTEPKLDIRMTADDKLFFEANKVRLQQVVDNLLSNAVKYRDRRLTSWLTISANIDKNSLNLCFEDNGVGFPENREKEAFEMFTRFHSSLSSGSGLGLAIVKKHIELMGGSISISPSQASTESLGSVIEINIPAPNNTVVE